MVFEKLKNMIVNDLGVSESKVTLDARLSEDLGIDSIDAVEIVMFIEDEYDISVSDEDAFALKTVKDLVTYVENLIK
ncbi:MAG TPA: acyl carrier protein [Acholeplasmataceae bacterium]|jgi:acyl carrier protein|nr:acyl carrier protein [Acholeplasmataceae bacterium]